MLLLMVFYFDRTGVWATEDKTKPGSGCDWEPHQLVYEEVSTLKLQHFCICVCRGIYHQTTWEPSSCLCAWQWAASLRGHSHAHLHHCWLEGSMCPPKVRIWWHMPSTAMTHWESASVYQNVELTRTRPSTLMYFYFTNRLSCTRLTTGTKHAARNHWV